MGWIWIPSCMLGAAVTAWLCVFVLNKIPANWLCDYGEQPGNELFGRRISLWPHGMALFAVLLFSFAGLFLQYGNTGFFYTSCVIAAVLSLIGIADLKYQIIPDQFVLFLVLAGVCADSIDLSGKHLIHNSVISPILGAAAGAGLMLAISLLGQLLYRKEALGFGDVKLFAAVGLMAGFPFVFFVFLLTILLAFLSILVLFIRRKIDFGTYFALGPFICLALLLFLAFHSQITGFTAWYFALLY